MFNKLPHLLTILILAIIGLTSQAIATAPLPKSGPSDDKVIRPDVTKPDPSLKPDEVVEIVMDALQHNDAKDSGIEITFRFASPSNRQVTGPLDHFVKLVKTPAYAPMLNFKSIEYGPIHFDADSARQWVTIVDATGAKLSYVFLLSRQAEGEVKGCWMTDGVMRGEPDANPPAPAAPEQPGEQPVKT